VTGGTAADTFTLSGAGNITGTIAGGAGTNTLAGNNLANTWAVTGANSGTLTDTNGTNAFTGIQNLTGGTGADTFTLPGGSISGVIDGGAGTDTLVSGNAANTWTINGANAGTLFDGAITTTFANVENLTGGTSADNFTIVGAGTISGTIAGGAGTDTLTANNGVNTWTITGTNAGTLSDGVSTATFTGIENTQGGAGADTFVFAGGSITGTMSGNAGTDTLVGGNGANTWAVTGLNSGTLTDAAGAHLFSSIENLTGGTAADTFTLSGTGHITGTISGGAGIDTLVGQNTANAWAITTANGGSLTDANGANAFTGVENLTGGTAVDTFTLSGTGASAARSLGRGADTLVGNGVGNTWAVTASTSGTLTDASGANAYTGIVNLTGGAGADSFVFSNGVVVGGVINGGAGVNTLNLGAYTTGRTVTLTGVGGAAGFNGTEASVGGGFQNITALVGAGSGVNSLTGINAGAGWAITATDSGTYTSTNALTFSAFQNVTGGTGADTFTLSGTGHITGTISGGLGTDTLVGNNLASTWAISALNAGTLTDANGANAFVSIENLAGGTAADTFNNVNISGALSDAGGTTTLNTNVTTGGGQSYAGPVAIGAAITITSGGSIFFGSTVTDPGFDLIVNATGNLTPGTMSVGAGRVQLFAGGTIVGGAGQSVSGTSTQQNVLSSGGNVTGLNVDFPNQVVLLTGSATAIWDLTGPPVVGSGPSPIFQIGAASISLRFNSVLLNGLAIAAIQQSGSVIGATLAEIARAALLEAQDTDSVQKQMAYGFSGDVGTTPPMDHRIDETGISVPVCFNGSREGQTCR
jgi:acrosin